LAAITVHRTPPDRPPPGSIKAIFMCPVFSILP
jgi:hypothetical protein